MSKYTLKLLQLIDYSPNQLKIRLTIEDESRDYTIRIGEMTYQSISNSLDGQEHHLCRLSFITKRNPFNDSFVSSMTLINGLEKRKISFNCDEAYAELLDKIRHANSFNEVAEIDALKLANEERTTESEKKASSDILSKADLSFEFENDKEIEKIDEQLVDDKLNQQVEAKEHRVDEVYLETPVVEIKETSLQTINQEESQTEEANDIKSLRQNPKEQQLKQSRKKEIYIKRIKNSIVAAVAFIAIVIFSGEYFFANENEKLELGQGFDLLAPPLQAEENEPSDGINETEDLDETSKENDLDKESDQEGTDELEESNETDEKNSSKEYEMVYYEVEDVAYHVPEGYVALTFDDGPSVFTKQIVDILTEHNVPATFFFVGDYVNKYPEDVIYTYEQGHAIASHTKSHKNIATLNYDEFNRELFESIDLLEQLTGDEVNLFRPPYGAITTDHEQILMENNIKTVMWNRDPRDWEARHKDDVLKYFYNTDPSGGIYILHENKYTLEALPEIIAYLQELGLDFVGIK